MLRKKGGEGSRRASSGPSPRVMKNKPLSIKAIILDMDGVIIDSEPVYRIAWQSAAAELGYEMSDEYYATLLGFTILDGEAAVTRFFGPDFYLPAFRDRWRAIWKRHVETKGIPVKPGLEELLRFLESRRLPVAVGTSSDAEKVAVSLRAAGLKGRFPCIVSGDQVAKGKPAPDIFLEAARRLRVAPEFCLVLEDSDAGIRAAAAGGIPAGFIPDLKPPSRTAAALAYRILPSLREALELIRENLTTS